MIVEIAVLELSRRIPRSILSRHGETIYVDADCWCCGSRFKVGELEVDESDEVSPEAIDEIVNEYERRTS